MNPGDDIGAGNAEQLIVALDVGMVLREALSAVVRLLQVFGLDHGSHGAVDDQDALLQGLFQGARSCCVACHACFSRW